MFEFRLMMGEGRQRVFGWVCSIDIEMEYSLDDMAPRVNNNDTGYGEADITSDHHFHSQFWRSSPPSEYEACYPLSTSSIFSFVLYGNRKPIFHFIFTVPHFFTFYCVTFYLQPGSPVQLCSSLSVPTATPDVSSRCK